MISSSRIGALVLSSTRKFQIHLWHPIIFYGLPLIFAIRLLGIVHVRFCNRLGSSLFCQLFTLIDFTESGLLVVHGERPHYQDKEHKKTTTSRQTKRILTSVTLLVMVFIVILVARIRVSDGPTTRCRKWIIHVSTVVGDHGTFPSKHSQAKREVAVVYVVCTEVVTDVLTRKDSSVGNNKTRTNQMTTE